MASIVGNLYIKSADGSQNIYQNSSFTFNSTTLGNTLATYTPGVTAVSNSIGGTAIDNSLQMGAVLNYYGTGESLTLYDVTPEPQAEKITGFYLDGTEYKIGGDEAVWGNIRGTLSDQTDLQNALNSKQNTLTAGENIKISSNVISANNVFIITEDDVTVSTDDTKGVAPYNTSYGYTNIDISASAGIEWREGAIYTFVVDTEMVVASAYRNVRVKIGNGTYIPVMSTTAALSGSSYFTKTNTRQYQYSTKYESGGALHLFTDSNTTYTAMSVSEGKTATATTVRGMRSDYLKQIIKYHAVDDTAYASSWNGVTDTAPSKNAVYDKIAAMDTTISGKQDTLTTQTAYTSKGSATKVPQITTNTLGQVTGITEVDITHPSQVDDTAYASSWNGVTSTAPSKNAVYDKISAMDTTISGKQDALTAQTAYTSKGTSSKVPQITTNILGQVTGITEVDISYPSQIDNTAYGSSWNGVTNKAPTKDAVYDKLNAIDGQISDLQAHGKFLSLWNSATGLPISFPLTTPYTYSTGDYYMVETLPSSGSKYMPNGSSYSGTASTTVDSVNEVKVGDMYIYDGSAWLYASNHGKDVTFSNIAGNPSDNTNLATALNGKQDKLSAQTAYTSKGTASKVPQITTNTLGQVTGITEVDISYPSQVSDVAYASSWNGVTTVAPSKNVVYDKINAMDTIIAGKQDALTAQTAYSAKGSATKVPQITTNSLGQVTGITEVTITHPSQVSDDYYSSSWDGVTTTAPSKNAVYDKISAMDTTISGKADAADVNTKTFAILDTTDTTTLQDAIDWYVAGKMPIVKYRANTFLLSSFQYVYDGQMNAQATFTSVSTVSSGDLIRFRLNINCTGNTISTVTETQETLISNTAYASSWDGVTGAAPTKDAVYDKISAMDTTISGKLDKVTTTATYGRVYGIGTDGSQVTVNIAPQVVNNALVRRTSTGQITVQQTPSANTDATSKKYVDDAIAGITAGDMSYSDFNAVAKTGATVTMDLFSTITPSANFTVNAPSSIKEGQTYILRVTNESTAYTMTLGTNMTNPFETDLTLTDYGVDQFVFLAVGGKLELQPEGGGGGGGGGAITADTTGTETSISKIWVGTEEEYANLGTYEENVAYMTY